MARTPLEPMYEVPRPPALPTPGWDGAASRRRFSAELAQWRGSVRWSQAYLGSLLGVGGRQVRRWEAGDATPDGAAALAYEALRRGQLTAWLASQFASISRRLEESEKISVSPP
jgi:transcriptional regulator with XRE-family HTH domain